MTQLQHDLNATGAPEGAYLREICYTKPGRNVPNINTDVRTWNDYQV